MVIELLQKFANLSILAFVVSSMLAMGLSQRLKDAVAPLRQAKPVALALLVAQQDGQRAAASQQSQQTRASSIFLLPEPDSTCPGQISRLNLNRAGNLTYFRSPYSPGIECEPESQRSRPCLCFPVETFPSCFERCDTDFAGAPRPCSANAESLIFLGRFYQC